jgi:radical SAM protein with 4Fe4S-binding SPASM domain
MSLDNFKRIVEESKDKLDQMALGGRGDVDQHENFEELLKLCRDNYIVPNFTTSGLGLTDRHAQICKEYCGAVAVSWYRHPHTLRAIETLLKAGVKTNIHYVLGKNSIDEAIHRLEQSTGKPVYSDPVPTPTDLNDFGFPKGINAIIFLLHKPVGQGKLSNMLSPDDPRLQEFFDLIDNSKFSFKIGFDSCTVPGIVNMTKNISRESIDTCEGGRYSCYVSADMQMVPCSFDQDLRWGVDLSKHTIQEAWNSEPFEDFRNHMRNACPECAKRESCMGGCPIVPEITLCKKC